MFLAVYALSLPKQSPERQIEGVGVLGFREKQVFLIILIFNLDFF